MTAANEYVFLEVHDSLRIEVASFPTRQKGATELFLLIIVGGEAT
jgi:hypothetical protein